MQECQEGGERPQYPGTCVSHFAVPPPLACPVLSAAWELGLVNIHVGTEYGGAGLHAVDGVVVSEELAYGEQGWGRDGGGSLCSAVAGVRLPECPVMLSS